MGSCTVTEKHPSSDHGRASAGIYDKRRTEHSSVEESIAADGLWRFTADVLAVLCKTSVES